MNIDQLREDLSLKSKNGLPFLLAAILVWSIIFVITLLPYSIKARNIYTLYSSGLMFPLAILISRIIKADWNNNDNPLGSLGLYLNIAQIMYFPLLFWIFAKNPEFMLMFFAIITGAHFFPYAWFYKTKSYLIMAPIISIIIAFIGWNIEINDLWKIPVAMVILLFVLVSWLYMDYRKVKRSQ